MAHPDPFLQRPPSEPGDEVVFVDPETGETVADGRPMKWKKYTVA